MQLKEYCKLKNKSLRQIAMNANIPYSTLNDLVNQKTDIKRVSFGMICDLADELELPIDDLRKMLSADSRNYTCDNEAYSIVVRNKRYYIDIAGVGREYLCKVNSITSSCIDDIALWSYRDRMVQKKMEEVDDLCFDAVTDIQAEIEQARRMVQGSKKTPSSNPDNVGTHDEL